MCRGGIDAFAAAGKLSAKGAAAVVGGKTAIQVSEGWRKGLSSDAKGENETLLQLEWERFSFYLADGADFSMRRAGLNTKTTAALHFGNTGDYGTGGDSDGSQ